MKHKHVIFYGLILAFSTVVFGAPELLLNPSFEEGSMKAPWDETRGLNSWSKWGNWGWAAWKYSAVSGIASHTGTKYVVAGANASGQHGVWEQTIIVEVGKSYEFEVWARSEGWGSAPNASMRVEFKNSSGSVLLSESSAIFSGSHPSPNVWGLYGFTTSAAPAGTVSATFQLRGDAFGSPIFDDASVSESGLSPDFNYDRTVDMLDWAEMGLAWPASFGEAGYDEIYDLNEDDVIDFGDVRIFVLSWLWYDTPVTASVDHTTVMQEIDGFGASFTDSSAWLVHDFLGGSEYLTLMDELFDHEDGIGLSYIRQPMGTSDMRRVADYSYDDMPAGKTDYSLANFSIAKDQAYIIPVLLKALEINPDIKIMSSPWSPPPWMKTNEDFQGGRLINTDAVYDAYAEYFVKYVQAYAAEGIVIDAITVQNEPGLEIGYPSLDMTAANQRKLIKKVGARFAAESIDTKIVCYDFNWNNTSFPLSVLGDATARGYIDGVAWHHYAGNVSAQTTVRNAYPSKNVYFTEGAIGEWIVGEEDFDKGLMRAANLLIDTTRNWAKCVVLWNMSLHELYNGPMLGNGCSTCYGIVRVHSVTSAVTKKSSYYALGQASKFVRAGAVRISSADTSSTAIKNVAFLNTDGTIINYVINEATGVRNYEVDWNGQSFLYPVAGRSVTTFKWPNETDAVVEVWVTTGDQSELIEQRASIGFHD